MDESRTDRELRKFEDLVERLGDLQTLPRAWNALNDAGNDALDAIREGLSHPNWRVRQFCAMFLDHFWDLRSLQRLLLSLHDPKLKVRRAAVHSLGCDRCKNGENPLDFVPHVAARIRDDGSIKVRRMAVMTLAIQTPEKRIAAILKRVLRDEADPKMRAYAKWGLNRYYQDAGIARAAAISE